MFSLSGSALVTVILNSLPPPPPPVMPLDKIILSVLTQMETEEMKRPGDADSAGLKLNHC